MQTAFSQAVGAWTIRDSKQLLFIISRRWKCIAAVLATTALCLVDGPTEQEEAREARYGTPYYLIAPEVQRKRLPYYTRVFHLCPAGVVRPHSPHCRPLHHRTIPQLICKRQRARRAPGRYQLFMPRGHSALSRTTPRVAPERHHGLRQRRQGHYKGRKPYREVEGSGGNSPGEEEATRRRAEVMKTSGH